MGIPLLELRDGLLGAFRAGAAENDRSAFCQKRLYRGKADAPAAAGYDCNFPFQQHANVTYSNKIESAPAPPPVSAQALGLV